MRWRNASSSRSIGTAIVSVVGAILLAVAVLGFIERSGGAESAGSRPPTHRVDFDIRSQPPVLSTTVVPRTTSTSVPGTTVTTITSSITATAATRPIPLPVSVSIPDVGISSQLIPLGLNPDNTLEVPKDFSLAGWYTGRPVPGEFGPSIIAGHVDSKRGPAVFYRLKDVQPGTTIDVARSDGTTARFRVVAMEQHAKDAFPTEHVYGPTDSPELRLITCGGTFNRSTGHYNDNLIVFAELSEIV
jgi:sortase (surface protein transpeptidase)